MNCQEVEEDGIVELHLAGRLSGARREAFERHFFDCDRCFAALRVAMAIRDAFEARDAERGDESE